MKHLFLRGILLLVVVVCAQSAMAQRLAVKTNALDWLILTPNASVEYRLNQKLSVEFGVAVNPVNKPIHGMKWANFRVQPQLRYWFNRPMARHFLAFSPMFMDYSAQWNNRKYTGDLLSFGFTYGYDLVLSHHWNMELSVGAGIGRTRCFHYNVEDKRPNSANYVKWIPVPQLGVTFAYIFE
ncbi:MAG: DUF3575 domain-containing protein [Paramuribaculum sp.]|nr:DUF3575 domain-containing protein [Paramuribaculum sp.]